MFKDDIVESPCDIYDLFYYTLTKPLTFLEIFYIQTSTYINVYM